MTKKWVPIQGDHRTVAPVICHPVFIANPQIALCRKPRGFTFIQVVIQATKRGIALMVSVRDIMFMADQCYRQL